MPDSLESLYGIGDDAAAPTLTWAGNLDESAVMSITYQVQVTGLVTGSLINQAVITTPNTQPLITLPISLSSAGGVNNNRPGFYLPWDSTW